MTPEPKCGQTEIGPLHLLEAMEIDFTSGREQEGPFGQTEFGPMVMLPAIAVDMSDVRIPMLQLTVRVRSGATPGDVAVDLHHLWEALNERELSEGGAGLSPGETTRDGECVRLTFRTTRLRGAKERLMKMADELNANGGVKEDFIEGSVTAVLLEGSIP